MLNWNQMWNLNVSIAKVQLSLAEATELFKSTACAKIKKNSSRDTFKEIFCSTMNRKDKLMHIYKRGNWVFHQARNIQNP